MLLPPCPSILLSPARLLVSCTSGTSVAGFPFSVKRILRKLLKCRFTGDIYQLHSIAWLRGNKLSYVFPSKQWQKHVAGNWKQNLEEQDSRKPVMLDLLKRKTGDWRLVFSLYLVFIIFHVQCLEAKTADHSHDLPCKLHFSCVRNDNEYWQCT